MAYGWEKGGSPVPQKNRFGQFFSSPTSAAAEKGGNTSHCHCNCHCRCPTTIDKFPNAIKQALHATSPRLPTKPQRQRGEKEARCRGRWLMDDKTGGQQQR